MVEIVTRSVGKALVASVLLVALVGSSGGKASAGDNRDPFGEDPLGLIAHYDLTTHLGLADDLFEVWTCHLTGGPYPSPGITAAEFTPVLGRSVGGYWSVASTGAYSVRFVAGGDLWDPPGGCVAGVTAASENNPRGVLILEFNSRYPTGGAGTGGVGKWCESDQTTSWCLETFPENGRFAIVQAGGGPNALAPPSAVVHELGHALGFSHSFRGLLPMSHFRREYDNPMDIMSGGGSSVYPVGMIAVNRYAAGWIPPEQVHVFEGGTDTVTLANHGSGTLMLAIPGGEDGLWLSVGARVQAPFNASPAEGVEVYVVDERPGGCRGNTWCWGSQRLVTPHPSDPNDPLAHVLATGQSVTWRNVTLTVASRTGGTFQVDVTDGTSLEPGTESGVFVDTVGSVHEPDIERIHDLGITVGCATRPARYCPGRSVTRAEMAAFLMRALGEPNPTPTITNPFADVTLGEWHTPFVLRVAELGVDTGADGHWRPGDLLTRLEMARWLTRTFDHISPVDAPQGLFVHDVTEGDWPVVEGLYEAGVTRGCGTGPLRYCPDRAVTRAQMASFIIRSLPQ